MELAPKTLKHNSKHGLKQLIVVYAGGTRHEARGSLVPIEQLEGIINKLVVSLTHYNARQLTDSPVQQNGVRRTQVVGPFSPKTIIITGTLRVRSTCNNNNNNCWRADKKVWAGSRERREVGAICCTPVAAYLMSQSSATPRSVQCLGLKSVSKSMEPTYLRSVRCGLR